MTLPPLINLGPVWSCIRRDRCWCIATLRSELEAGETPRGYLKPGTYNGNFLKVTEVTGRVPEHNIEFAIRERVNRFPNPYLKAMTPKLFKELYVIHRHYETTMD